MERKRFPHEELGHYTLWTKMLTMSYSNVFSWHLEQRNNRFDYIQDRTDVSDTDALKCCKLKQSLNLNGSIVL